MVGNCHVTTALGFSGLKRTLVIGDCSPIMLQSDGADATNSVNPIHAGGWGEESAP